MTRHQFGLCVALGLYLLGLGFLGGMAAERIRFDQARTAVLDRYNDKIREWHQFRMLVERQAMAYPADGPGDQTTPGSMHAIGTAAMLAEGEVQGAMSGAAFSLTASRLPRSWPRH
jgi:hypothetical protein